MKKYKSEILVDGLVFPECPRFKNGNLWFTNIFGKRVTCIKPTGELVAEYNIFAPGFGWLPDGNLV
jgi:hypothetical protein